MPNSNLAIQQLQRENEELRRKLAKAHESMDADLHGEWVVKYAIDGIIAVDARGAITAFNPAAEQIFGYTANEVIGRSVTMLMTEAFPVEDNHSSGNGPRTGPARIFGIEREVEGKRKDGSLFPLDLTVNAFQLREQWHFIGIVRDITERKRAEVALRESAAREQAQQVELETLLDAIPSAVFIAHDVACKQMTGNRAAMALLRVPAGRNPSASAPENERPEYEVWSNGRRLSPTELPMQRAAATGQAVSGVESKIVFSNGESVHLLGSALPLFDSSGTVRGCVGTFVDITAHKCTEDALRESEQRMRLATEATEVGIWERNVVTGQVHWDAQMFRIYGIAPTEDGITHYGMWSAAVLPEDLSRQEEVLNDTIRRAGHSTREFRIRRANDGECCHIRAVETVRTNALGQVEWLVGTNLDVTERKRAQVELERAKAAEEEASRQKDRFLAVLSHELRNPLMPISYAANLLKCADLSDAVRRQLPETIDRQVTHMTRLIDELLDVSRIANGKITLQKKEMNLTAVATSVVEDQHALLESSGVQLELKLPSKPLYVFGDSVRLAQIICNLLVNATKFSDRGGTVTVELKEDGLSDAVICVRDTGIGMEPATLSRIFEPFMQADSSAERNRSSLGLGLELVKGLTELHGGQVRATSAGLGKGSEIVVRLPILIREPKETTAVEKARTRPAARALRILIVDDNVSAVETTRALLELAGHSVSVAHSGTEGLATAQSLDLDVMICDIGLPGSMDGYALAKAVRETPHLRSVQLIAVTGYGQEKDRKRAQDAGFDHHLIKPAPFDKLERLLER